jgi:methionyl-tRNA formyltransferase
MAMEEIVVIGTGPLACRCVEIAFRTTPRVRCVEPEKRVMSRLPALCRSLGVEYRCETDRGALKNYFESIQRPTLVVSAYNMFIFPRTVIDNPQLLLVNFHNSLLPRHAGRNAPTWAIFAEDAETGVTWHLVEPRVDGGDIVMQAALPIGPFETAIALTRRTLELGAETFGTLLPDLWNGNYRRLPQSNQSGGAINKSTDVPNGGVLDLSWDAHRISALLRSVDYGGLPVFPPLKLSVGANEYRVTRYAITADANASAGLDIEPPHAEIRGDGVVIRLTLTPIEQASQ